MFIYIPSCISCYSHALRSISWVAWPEATEVIDFYISNFPYILAVEVLLPFVYIWVGSKIKNMRVHLVIITILLVLWICTFEITRLLWEMLFKL